MQLAYSDIDENYTVEPLLWIPLGQLIFLNVLSTDVSTSSFEG